MKIVVTGATGQLGRLVVKHLLDRVDASRIVASVRDPAKATNLGVEVRHGDFEAPETLATAFSGADRVLIISSQGDDETRLRQHQNAIKAAKDAGVSRLVYTSLTHADTTKIGLANTHRPTEAAIKASGVPYTLLRNNWYLENDLGTVAGALATGTVNDPTGGGAWAPATRDDFAEAAAVVLSTDGHDNAVYELGAPVSAGYADWAEALSVATGREIAYHRITLDEHAANLTAAGLPAEVVDMLVDAHQGIGLGELDVPGDDLAKLLGREPTTLRDWITGAVRAQQA